MTDTLPRPPAPAPPGGIDPRIRARRVAVVRAQGRRRLRILIVVAAVVVTSGIAYLVVESPLLDVDAVEVAGVAHLTPDAVVTAAAVPDGAALARLDTAAVAERVEALPWVASASVHRDFPGTVRIEVIERTPRAFVRADDGTVVLIGADGTVLGSAPSAPEGALEVLGLRRTPSAGSLLSPPGAAHALDALPDALAARVGTILLGEPGAVALGLRDGGAIRLGSLDDLVAKGAAAAAVLERLPADAALDYIDVRVPSAPSVRLLDR
ncbi:MAG TPA: FtsQ-type POTRA domain-containing protein [Acidimicrobiia bacterium]|nr:FtsQ-type POTRA domain-containing protein [Acidimicrobiia bacterium]